MRALVVANGQPPSDDLLRELARGADLVVAADGGAEAALAAGVRLHAVVGDMDSASDMVRERMGESRLIRDQDADRTDLQKAIDYCLARRCDAIDVAGAGGGRADHALANLSVLVLNRGRARVCFHDDLFEISLVVGTTEIDAPPGTVVSLVAIGACTGVTTRGLRWDLADFALSFSPYGVHNEVAAPPARVTVRRGDLLLFRGRWIEKHR